VKAVSLTAHHGDLGFRSFLFVTPGKNVLMNVIKSRQTLRQKRVVCFGHFTVNN